MRKKAIGVAVIAVTLSSAAILYRFLQPTTCSLEDILAVYQEHVDYDDVTIERPLNGTLFPPEMIPPLFRWSDGTPASKAWLVRIAFADGKQCMCFLARRQQWTPRRQDWKNIKHRSLEREAQVVILGINPSEPARILSKGLMSFRISRDPVEAPLFYREVNLPFVEADKDPSRVRWRFGSIASPKPPPVVLKDLPVCGNCHSFSRDGKTLAMDVDYASRKGSYIITAVKEQTVLDSKDIITWTDQKNAEQTNGLLSQISPDGRYAISTVRDLSVFVPKPEMAFSQLFFPIKGILCVFDRETGRFRELPGADDLKFVQSNPTWSPDGEYIVFARAKAPDLRNTKHQGFVWLTPSESTEFVASGKPFLFDLYRIPFNGGQGGTAEPIEGASNNGMSNYFARYSPDGRWIVFCRAKSYMLLQPDSELYIIPAEGGNARRLRCNTSRMNSWHSFSPNGKWLVFASKAYSDYTQLCLTHIDENGYSTPPVLLAHLTAPDRAANIPEFVNTHPAAIANIHKQFLND
jgi:dipeptidyl aminopeptidase/acylaminoacyl peptidase